MMYHDIIMLFIIHLYREGNIYVRSPPHSDTSSSGSTGGESMSLSSLGISIGDRVVIGAVTSRQPKGNRRSSEEFSSFC